MLEPTNYETDYGSSPLFILCFQVGLAQSVACPPLAQVVSPPLDRVIPKAIIKMVQTASLHRHTCVRV